LGAGDQQERGDLARVKNAIQKLNRIIAGVGALFLIPMMLLTAADVTGRNLFNRPIAGTMDLSQYMLAVFILLGLAYSQQAKAHVKVSLLVSRLSPRSQALAAIVSTLMSLSVLGVLAWQGWVVGWEEKTVSDMLRIPQYPFRLLLSMAASLFCLELLIDMGDALKQLVQRG
jgi:TRAP-type C4-dicarboxylate transport system permease small subunit